MSGAGTGVDVHGGPVIDPTENVLALVDVQKDHSLSLRVDDNKYHEAMLAAEAKYQDGMRHAEVEKQRELASLKQVYDKQISDILTVQVKTTSELISTQLDKVTTSLSNQINAAAVQQMGLTTTLSERIGRLEQAQWQSAGKTSVSDPATADALTKMALAVQSLTMTEKKSEGQVTGRDDMVKWFIAALTIVIAIAAIYVKN
jgi:hypothetical protein